MILWLNGQDSDETIDLAFYFCPNGEQQIQAMNKVTFRKYKKASMEYNKVHLDSDNWYTLCHAVIVVNNSPVNTD